MKTATNIAIVAALLALVFFAGGAVSGFAGVGLFFFLLGKAMDFYALPDEKKKDDQLPDAGKTFSETLLQKSAPHPDATSPASTGFQTEGTTTGERYYRNEEQAASGDYTNPDAPADTVQIANADAPAKPGKSIELEMT